MVQKTANVTNGILLGVSGNWIALVVLLLWIVSRKKRSLVAAIAAAALLPPLPLLV